MSFLYQNDVIVTTGTNPDTGNPISNREYVPRNLPALSDEKWENGEFVAKALGLQMGRKVRTTKKGHEVRDVFFTKVEGDGNYSWKRIGVMFSGERQDTETGEIIRWHSFVAENESTGGSSSTQTPAAPATAPAQTDTPSEQSDETPADSGSDDQAAADAQDAVESI